MSKPSDADARAKNTLGQSVYDFNYRVFPEDLGQEDMAHYMVININVPVLSFGQPSPVSKSFLVNPSTILKDEQSKVDRLRFGETSTSFAGGFGGTGVSPVTPSRGTRRIKESIALHMPNGGLVYTEDNKYEEISMTAMGGGLITSGIKSGINSIFGRDSELGKQLIELTDATGNAIKRGGQLAGYPVNPAVEVLFATRPQRQWMFEVFMLPRSENEVETVREIIRTLRFHAAPEVVGQGFFFVPPAEFDITFFHKEKKISTCLE